MTTESEFINAYERIKCAHKTILKDLDAALKLEENGQGSDALSRYEQILQDIEQAFVIPVGLPDNIDAVEDEWLDACAMIQKLKKAKQELFYRIQVLRSTQQLPIDLEAREAQEQNENEIRNGIEDQKSTRNFEDKPSVLKEHPKTHVGFESAVVNTRNVYKRIIQNLRELLGAPDADVQYDTLFQAQVKLYKIEKNGGVGVVAGETCMSLVMCTVGEPWQHLNGICFIQCPIAQGSCTLQTSSQGSMIWIYPLLPSITNCYRTDYGAFIFPDMESDDISGSTAFGIMLTPSGLADEVDAEAFSDLQQFFLDLLEAILAGPVQQLQYTEPELTHGRDVTSTKISRNVVNVADFIARNLVRGAEKTGQLMDHSTPYIISKLQRAPENPAPVSTTLQTSASVAKTVSTTAVGVTGWIATKVGAAATAVGGYLAPHVQTQGAKLLECGFGYDKQEANSKMEGALTIAAGAVEGASKVYNGLEDAASILGNRLSDNSVKIIEHKYGTSAGVVAADTFDTIGNAFRVSENVNYIKPKGLVKKLAKNTGKAVVIDYKKLYENADEDKITVSGNVIAAGNLYPDLRNLKND